MAHLSASAVKQIEEIIARYKDEKTPLMMILSDIQNEYGYIPLDVQELVSEKTGIPVAEIYGVVTFYSFFSLKPKGKYVIGVCLGTACYVKGAQQIIDELSELIDSARETTVQSKRADIYAEALDLVMDLAVELPTYQRNDCVAYTNIINPNSLNQKPNAFSGVIDRLWELDYVK